MKTSHDPGEGGANNFVSFSRVSNSFDTFTGRRFGLKVNNLHEKMKGSRGGQLVNPRFFDTSRLIHQNVLFIYISLGLGLRFS